MSFTSIEKQQNQETPSPIVTCGGESVTTTVQETKTDVHETFSLCFPTKFQKESTENRCRLFKRNLTLKYSLFLQIVILPH